MMALQTRSIRMFYWIAALAKSMSFGKAALQVKLITRPSAPTEESAKEEQANANASLASKALPAKDVRSTAPSCSAAQQTDVCTGQCPGRCSGHGQCRTLREIAANAMTKTRVKSENGIQIHEGVVEKFDYDLWDADMNQACVCDPGFAGNDCSERLCPRGDDPLTNSREFCGERPCHNSVQQFDLTSNGENKLRFEFADWKGRSQAISVSVNTANDDPGLVAEADAATKLAGSLSTAGKVMYAIRSAFPEDYLAQVEVRAAGTVAGASTFTADTASPGATNRYFITFTGAPGRQDLIKLVGESAVANSVAYVEAVETASGYATATAGATNTFPLHGNNEELPCSGRGACNKLSGLCECFAGYYGAACDYQNVLVM